MTYPNTIDALVNPTPTDSETTVSHLAQHVNANNAIEFLESENYTGWQETLDTFAYAGANLMNPTTLDFDRYTEKMKVSLDQTLPTTAYWSFDVDTTDAKGNLNNSQTDVTIEVGKYGNCARFNGTTSHIDLADSPLVKPTGPFTIFGWIKTATAGGIMQSYSLNTPAAGFKFLVSGTVLTVVQGKNTGVVANIDYTQVLGTIPVTDNSWHFVAYTYQNNYGKLIVDGVLDRHQYMLEPAYATTNYATIGSTNHTGTNIGLFNGQMDDIKFLNGYALSEECLKEIFESGVPASVSDVPMTQYFEIKYKTATGLRFETNVDYMLYNLPITNVKVSREISPKNWPTCFTDWKFPSLQNGWLYYNAGAPDWYPPAFMKDANGFVHFRGCIRDGVISPTAVAHFFDLPYGFRNTKHQGFLCYCGNTPSTATVYVLSNGGATCIVGANNYLMLDSIKYKAEQ